MQTTTQSRPRRAPVQRAFAQGAPTLGPPQNRLTNRYFGWLCFVLLGYALLGKGFAYLGARPLFIGEITLLLGLVALASSRPAAQMLRRCPTLWPLGVMMLWGAACTVPYLSTYGATALRDAVVWGYALFAVIAAALLIDKPSRLKLLFHRYQRFVLLFVGLIWAFRLVLSAAPGLVPHLPGSPVPLIYLKAGDILVHSGGVAVFLLLGMAYPRPWLVFLLVAELFIGGIHNRGGLLSAVLAVGVTLLLKPSTGSRLAQLAAGLCVFLVLLLIIQPEMEVGGKELSVEQFWDNVESVFTETESGRLEGTKEWRLNWWGDIIGYTIGGPHFWTGKGFGINLANSDGYQVTHDDSLRSPHNAHLTMLARAGVPGFVLWILVHLTWLVRMLKAYFRSLRRGDRAWSSVFLFLIAYWTAFMTNASFDVYLESPMGGVWFWALFGFGIGAMQIYAHRPEVLWSRPEPSPARAETERAEAVPART